jgi:hypothetical protein
MNPNAQHAPENDEALAVGVLELAILTAVFKQFVQQPRFNYLYAIDAPTIASVHALPPHHITHFAITELLRTPEKPEVLKGKSADQRRQHFIEQAQGSPLATGLTEIIARYLFDGRWSSGLPKVIMPSQIGPLSTIVDATKRAAFGEWNTTTRSATDNPLLNLAQRLKQKDQPSDATAFINELTSELEDLLPAIYGEYTASRQSLRFAEVLPSFPESSSDTRSTPELPRTVFADTFSQLSDIVGELEAAPDTASVENVRFADLLSAWENALPPAPNSTEEDSAPIARTLAEIEFLNRWLSHHNEPLRIAFFTTTARVFDGALKRFGVHEARRKPKYDRPSYNKLRYMKYLAAADEATSPLAFMPLLDPRILMTGPDFVNFANREEKTAVDDEGRAISAWLPSIVGGKTGRLDIEELFNQYESIQFPELSRGNPSSASLIGTVSFLPKDQAKLVRDKWGAYIKLVSAVEGSERVLRRQMFHDIRVALLKQASNDPNELRRQFGEQLDQAMGAWTAETSGFSLTATLRKKSTAAPKRNVPPLILPSFAKALQSIHAMLNSVKTKGAPDTDSFAWLTKPTPEAFGLQPDDPKANEKTRYLQLLAQGLLFAHLGNWEAAYNVSTLAYSWAYQFLARSKNADEFQYISGREAAYFASVACRRMGARATAASQVTKRGLGWVDELEESLHQFERDNLSKPPNERFTVHLIRAGLEALAWDTFNALNEPLKPYGRPRTSSLSRSVLSSLRQRVAQQVAKLKDQNVATWAVEEASTREAYARAVEYLRLQLDFISANIELLLTEHVNHSDIAPQFSELARIAESHTARLARKGADEFSELENRALNAAIAVSERNSVLPIPDDLLPHKFHDRYEAWRHAMFEWLASAEQVTPAK